MIGSRWGRRASGPTRPAADPTVRAPSAAGEVRALTDCGSSPRCGWCSTSTSPFLPGSPR
ncbi:hypothetical protein HBB16_08060 [Pseudonocardia sp. MCCB 268]|nr:hypothetical protein [Pseudonocardia cytotoxica]